MKRKCMKTGMVSSTTLAMCAAALGLFIFQVEMASSTVTAQDPGVRAGDAGAGGAIAGLSPSQIEYFLAGQADFAEAEERCRWTRTANESR